MMKLLLTAFIGAVAASNHTGNDTGNLTDKPKAGTVCTDSCAAPVVIAQTVLFPVPGNATATQVGALLKNAVLNALKTAKAVVVADNIFITKVCMDGDCKVFTRPAKARMLAVSSKKIEFEYEVTVSKENLAALETASGNVDAEAFFTALKTAVLADTTMGTLYANEGVAVGDLGAMMDNAKAAFLTSYKTEVKAAPAAASAFQTGAFAAIATALIALAF